MSRIYVASLADYNSGSLHGAWIEVSDVDTMQGEIATMLRGSKYPNVFVCCPDCEGAGVIFLPNGTRDKECPLCHGRGQVASAEEYAIHDYEGFEGIKVEEYSDLQLLCDLSEAIEEHGEAFAAWWNNSPADSIDLDGFQDAYLGTFDTLIAWAEDWVDQIGMLSDVNETIARYFDYESFARDSELGGDIYTVRTSDGLAVFSNI